MRSYAAVAVALLLTAVPAHAAEVFMSLTRGETPVSDAPSNIEVIKSEDFEKTSARTVADAVASQPGLIITSAGSEGFLQTPSIRGFSAQQVLIVIDDVPQTPDLTGNVDLSRIMLDNVDRIEVLRGGASAVYGPNAEGGVIHIITKKPITAVDVQVTSEGGSYNTFNNRFLVGTNQGPIQAQVTGSRDLSDGFQQNSSFRNTDLTGFLAYDAKRFGKLSYNIEVPKAPSDCLRERPRQSTHGTEPWSVKPMISPLSRWIPIASIVWITRIKSERSISPRAPPITCRTWIHFNSDPKQ